MSLKSYWRRRGAQVLIHKYKHLYKTKNVVKVKLADYIVDDNPSKGKCPSCGSAASHRPVHVGMKIGFGGCCNLVVEIV